MSISLLVEVFLTMPTSPDWVCVYGAGEVLFDY